MATTGSKDYLALALPPGMAGNGTLYQKIGRWIRGRAMRFYEKTVRPIGGWERLPTLGVGKDSLANYLDSFADASGTLSGKTWDIPGENFAGDVTGWDLSGTGYITLNTTGRSSTDRAARTTNFFVLGATNEMWLDYVGPATQGALDVATMEAGNIGIGLTDGVTSSVTLGLTIGYGSNGGHQFLQISAARGAMTSTISPTATFDGLITGGHPLYPGGSMRFGITFLKSGNDAGLLTLWTEPFGGNSSQRVAVGSATPSAGNGWFSGDTYFAVCNRVVAGFPPSFAPQIHSAAVSTNPTASPTVQLDGVCRRMLGWRTNTHQQMLAFGTNTNLYAMVNGALYLITPSGFVTGDVNTVFTLGSYGGGNYGAGLYGTGDDTQGTTVVASVWHLDNFGDYLVGCSYPNDNKLYYWTGNTAQIAQVMNGVGAVLTSDGTIPTAGDTVTIGSVTYTFRAAVSTIANEVLLGTSAAEALQNLFWAIEGTQKSGVAYGTLTLPHPQVTPVSLSQTTLQLLAFDPASTISTTETSTHLSFGAATVSSAYGTQAPLLNVGVVVTPEEFVVALGAGNVARNMQWASQGTLTDWVPSETNSAGALILQSTGEIICGRRSTGETLIWTNEDLHALRYIGTPLIYSQHKLGSTCGIAGPNAVAMVGTKAVWWGSDRKFHIYDGFVQELPCEVSDAIYNDINWNMKVKIAVCPIGQYGEVRWYYCSASGTEVDRCVVWNWIENHWTIDDAPARTAGCDAGPIQFVTMTDAQGAVWQHETGGHGMPTSGTDATQIVPYIESGPVEIGTGKRVMEVYKLIPDENTLGDAQMSLIGAYYPAEGEQTPTQETTYGPFAIASQQDVRLTARQVRLKVEQVRPVDWRLGTVRLDVQARGTR